MTAATRIRLESSGPVARLTLTRPEVRNAFDDTLILELGQALERLAREYEAAPDAAPRALVVTGEGSAFCAGADLNWMRRGVTYTREENEADARRMAAMYRSLDEIPLPTIARVNGTALGGGMGLLACCDIAIAVETAQFGFTEARLGIAPAVISPFVIAKVGLSAARRYFLTAEIFGAAEAKSMGLVHEIVAESALDDAVERVVVALAGNGPSAVAASKRLIRQAAAAPSRDAALDNAVRAIAELRASPEGQEGLGAFLEKRTPAWKR